MLFSNRLIPCFFCRTELPGKPVLPGLGEVPPTTTCRWLRFTVVEDLLMPFLDGWSPLWAEVCLLKSEPPMSTATQGQVRACQPSPRPKLPPGAWLAGHPLEAHSGACGNRTASGRAGPSGCSWGTQAFRAGLDEGARILKALLPGVPWERLPLCRCPCSPFPPRGHSLVPG